MTEFTETELELLATAWALKRSDHGFVPAEEVLAECEKLEKAGWLERRTVDATGDVAFRWTREAEMAFDLDQLKRSGVEGREN